MFDNYDLFIVFVVSGAVITHYVIFDRRSELLFSILSEENGGFDVLEIERPQINDVITIK